MSLLNEYCPKIADSSTLEKILKGLEYDSTNCKSEDGVTHVTCFRCDNQLPYPLCPNSLMDLILNLLAYNCNVVDDNCQVLVSEYFRKNQLKPPCIINFSNLIVLQNSKRRTLTWIKFESLLIRLIKDHVYEPKCMSNEVLTIVKTKLPTDLRERLASVVQSCVPHCQKVIDNDEEEKNKWCVILDWMSWFLGGDRSSDSE